MADIFTKPFGSDGSFGRRILTPSRLCAQVQELFDAEFGTVWVEGEVSELSLPRSGHAYFYLKEKAGGQEVRVKAVMWKGRRLGAGAALTEGQMVLARGRLAVYAPRGDFQLVADYLEPKGEGALRLAFEKLKAKLTEEGLFDEDRKRGLPFWPRKVAVVSSAGGAAVSDFIRTAQARRPRAAISLYPVLVQGPGASREIAEAMSDLNAWGGFDLIVLTRGGGSLSDLWAFNEEETVRAVAASRTPTLAAIGHSTDLSLAELAADQRAITPTAAAEAVFRDEAAIRALLAETVSRLGGGVAGILERETTRLARAEEMSRERIERRLHLEKQTIDQLRLKLGRFEDRLGLIGQRVDEMERRLFLAAGGQLEHSRRRLSAGENSLRLLSPRNMLTERGRELSAITARLSRAAEATVADQRRRLETALARLTALSPQSVLDRGYALVSRGPGGEALLRAADLAPGQKIAVRLSEGAFTAEVEEII